MTLNSVHDVQSAYRELITAMSYPGTVVNVCEQASRVDLESSLPRPLLLLSIMLLDAEVSFCLLAPQSETERRILSQLTYSRAVAEDAAAFLLVDTGSGDPDPRTEAEVDKAISAVGIGTLESPHLGATVVLRVAALRDELRAPAPGERVLTLSGPGIKGRRSLGVAGFTGWVERRREKNREYPLGIDLILYTSDGEIAAVPRTTQIVETRVWDT